MSTSMNNITVRDAEISKQIVFLDGLTGTGKTMLAPILSSLHRVETHRIEHIYEYLCGLTYLDQITSNASANLIRMYVDLACYNMMIGREVNFRLKDLSGVLTNPGGLKYIGRLLKKDGDTVVDRINEIDPIVHIISHQILGISKPLFSALGSRLIIIESVRHPLNLLRHWYSYIDRHGTDPRDFTLWISHEGQNLPWFALGWEEKYLTSTKMDRVIYSIEQLTNLSLDTKSEIQHQYKNQVLTIPFELFVSDPTPFIESFKKSLKTHTSNSTNKTLRKQKVPRAISTAGKDLPIYRRYNWSPPNKTLTESDILKNEWHYVSTLASPEGLTVLKQMCIEYEARYFPEHYARLQDILE